MRRMSYGIASLVLVASLAMAGTAVAKTAVITVDGQVGGKEKPKFDKKKFKPTNIKIDTTTADAADRERHAAEGLPVGGRIRQEERQVQPRRGSGL